jgi:hypothetical protein
LYGQYDWRDFTAERRNWDAKAGKLKVKTFTRLKLAVSNASLLQICSTIDYSLIWCCVSTPFFVTSRSKLQEEDLDSPEKDFDDIQDLKEEVNNLSCLLKELQLQKQKQKHDSRDKNQVWAIAIKIELH